MVGDREVASLGKAGPVAALAVDEELNEVPFAFLDLGKIGSQPAVRELAPAGDLPHAAHEGGFRGGVPRARTLENPLGIRRTGIDRLEDDRPFSPISSGSDQDGGAHVGRQLPERISRTDDRGFRAIGFRSARGGKLSRPTVVS